MKITKITKLHEGLYAHVCPLCNAVHASSSDPEWMPDFSICRCDSKEKKAPAYELYMEGGCTMIRRNKPPRFTGKVTFGLDSDIEDIEFMDQASALEMAKALRKAGEFLIKNSRRNDRR